MIRESGPEKSFFHWEESHAEMFCDVFWSRRPSDHLNEKKEKRGIELDILQNESILCIFFAPA